MIPYVSNASTKFVIDQKKDESIWVIVTYI